MKSWDLSLVILVGWVSVLFLGGNVLADSSGLDVYNNGPFFVDETFEIFANYYNASNITQKIDGNCVLTIDGFDYTMVNNSGAQYLFHKY